MSEVSETNQGRYSKIILASKSPRRRELLASLGLEFEVMASELPEVVTETNPAKVVEELSRQKAEEVYAVNAVARGRSAGQALHGESRAEILCDPAKLKAEDGLIVIGADTVVSVDGKILGKPKDEEDAFSMLKLLQGRTHQVYTGVTLVYNNTGGSKSEVDADTGSGASQTDVMHIDCETTFNMCTDVTFYPMSDEEISEYIGTGDPMDKAGAYGIQSGGAKFVKEIRGDYNNVVGLPISRLYQELKKL